MFRTISGWIAAGAFVVLAMIFLLIPGMLGRLASAHPVLWVLFGICVVMAIASLILDSIHNNPPAPIAGETPGARAARLRSEATAAAANLATQESELHARRLDREAAQSNLDAAVRAAMPAAPAAPLPIDPLVQLRAEAATAARDLADAEAELRRMTAATQTAREALDDEIRAFHGVVVAAGAAAPAVTPAQRASAVVDAHFYEDVAIAEMDEAQARHQRDSTRTRERSARSAVMAAIRNPAATIVAPPVAPRGATPVVAANFYQDLCDAELAENAARHVRDVAREDARRLNAEALSAAAAAARPAPAPPVAERHDSYAWLSLWALLALLLFTGMALALFGSKASANEPKNAKVGMTINLNGGDLVLEQTNNNAPKSASGSGSNTKKRSGGGSANRGSRNRGASSSSASSAAASGGGAASAATSSSASDNSSATASASATASCAVDEMALVELFLLSLEGKTCKMDDHQKPTAPRGACPPMGGRMRE